jgi:hypothetical protein
MNCREIKDRLTTGADRPSGEAEKHLLTCESCARLAERMRLAGELLSKHHGGIEPDEHFATRVTARLHVAPATRLGWAAIRVLPATLALLLLLAWMTWQSTPAPGNLFQESPTDDLLTWVLDRAGEER